MEQARVEGWPHPPDAVATTRFVASTARSLPPGDRRTAVDHPRMLVAAARDPARDRPLLEARARRRDRVPRASSTRTGRPRRNHARTGRTRAPSCAEPLLPSSRRIPGSSNRRGRPRRKNAGRAPRHVRGRPARRDRSRRRDPGCGNFAARLLHRHVRTRTPHAASREWPRIRLRARRRGCSNPRARPHRRPATRERIREPRPGPTRRFPRRPWLPGWRSWRGRLRCRLARTSSRHARRLEHRFDPGAPADRARHTQARLHRCRHAREEPWPVRRLARPHRRPRIAHPTRCTLEAHPPRKLGSLVRHRSQAERAAARAKQPAARAKRREAQAEPGAPASTRESHTSKATRGSRRSPTQPCVGTFEEDISRVVRARENVEGPGERARRYIQLSELDFGS